MSSSQQTKSIIFQRGRWTTNQIYMYTGSISVNFKMWPTAPWSPSMEWLHAPGNGLGLSHHSHLSRLQCSDSWQHLPGGKLLPKDAETVGYTTFVPWDALNFCCHSTWKMEVFKRRTRNSLSKLSDRHQILSLQMPSQSVLTGNPIHSWGTTVPFSSGVCWFPAVPGRMWFLEVDPDDVRNVRNVGNKSGDSWGSLDLLKICSVGGFCFLF